MALRKVLVDYNICLTGLLQSPDGLATSADDASYDAWRTLDRPLNLALWRVVADYLLNEVLGCVEVVGVVRSDSDGFGVTGCCVIDLNPCLRLLLQVFDGLATFANNLADKGGGDLHGGGLLTEGIPHLWLLGS